MARVDRVDIDTPDDQFEENTETVRLIDGHRCVYSPVCFIKRNKIPAGEYLIFYRAAFTYEPTKIERVVVASSPASNASSKVPDDVYPDFLHE